MSALSDFNVGRYLNRHFVSTFQKIGTFRIQHGVKNGGNVACYFCTSDGKVLHAIAGPVDANIFLREARWANETYRLARIKERNESEMRNFFRNAHMERLQNEHHVRLRKGNLPEPAGVSSTFLEQLLARNGHLHLNNQGKIHLLCTAVPLPRLDQLYATVFEKILNEKISTNPVDVAGN